MTPRVLRLLMLLAGAAPAWCGAETAYVIDKLLVGVHAEKSLDSEIIKVLPTGTRLEIVERDGQVALIRDPDGVAGWIDATYLMGDKPASMVVSELEEQTRELQADLAGALAKVEELAANTTPDAVVEASDPPAQLEELEQRLSSARIKNGEMEAELREANALNREIRAELDHLKAQATASAQAVVQPEAPSDSLALSQLMRQGSVHVLLITALILIVMAFGGGVFLMDYLQRRRHGGFRI